MSWQPQGWQPEGWQPDGWQLDEEVPAAPFESLDRFHAPIEQRVFLAMSDEADFTFDAVEKDPSGQRKVELNFYRWCANTWRANEEVGSGEFFRPSRPNGFSYEVTAAGLTGAREPTWPSTIGQTVQSGSAVFTSRAAGANGLNAISGEGAVSSPTGLTIALSVSEYVKIIATYGVGGSEGQDFEAVYSFTLDGITRIARQIVRVRKQ